MIKYVDTKVVFAEVPDEITLAINISGCPFRCHGCHSKYLWEDKGTILNRDSLYQLIESNNGITCIAFMGGDSDLDCLCSIIYWVRTRFPDLKIAWYTGRGKVENTYLLKNLDYLKVGPYVEELGPLNSNTTNQRMYSVNHSNKTITLEDITSKFWDKKI